VQSVASINPPEPRPTPAPQSVAVSTQYTGTVTGVDLSGSQPLLQVGSSYLTISQIRSIQRPGP